MTNTLYNSMAGELYPERAKRAEGHTTPRPTAVLWHIAMPFFLFSTVLVLLLTLSWTLLLPRYTRIDVGGQLRDAQQIRTYRTELTAEIASKEEERRQAVLAVHDPAYDTLKDLRKARTPLDELRTALAEHAKKVTGKDDVILFSAFDYDPAAKTLVIRGDVRNSDTRSMTVLAEFSMSLTDLPFVTEASTPTFAREEDSKIGFHSPFTITLTLK